MKKNRLICTSILVFSLCPMVFADSFRVRKVHVAPLELTTKDELAFDCAINDGIAVSLPEDKVFLEGIEFKMNIPEGISSWPDSVACSIYGKTTPLPKAGQIDYSGNRVFVRTLPGRMSWILQVPVTKKHNIKANNFATTADVIPDVSSNFVFLRFQTVMKGLQEDTMNSLISVTVRPILSDKGRIILNLSSAENELRPVSVYIDDVPMGSSDLKNLIVPAGIHNLSVVSNDYRNETRTIYVDQAKSTEVSIQLKGVEPALSISAPQGTKVFVDNKPVADIESEVVVSEGEHTIKCTVGDYEVIRTVKVEKGKIYKVNFEVELTISDE